MRCCVDRRACIRMQLQQEDKSAEWWQFLLQYDSIWLDTVRWVRWWYSESGTKLGYHLGQSRKSKHALGIGSRYFVDNIFSPSLFSSGHQGGFYPTSLCPFHNSVFGRPHHLRRPRPLAVKSFITTHIHRVLGAIGWLFLILYGFFFRCFLQR